MISFRQFVEDCTNLTVRCRTATSLSFPLQDVEAPVKPLLQASTAAGFPRISARRRRLLGLLDAFGGRVGSLDLQKLLFLYCQELSPKHDCNVESWYEFVPYRYGAFSLTCCADRRRLVKFKLLADNDNWELTKSGRQLAKLAQDGPMRAFANRYERLRGNPLVAKTYRKYPYYAIRSEIAEEILGNDARALGRIAAARPEKARSKLITIGYERRSLENYLNKLLRAGVTVLCDVRKNAVSRKYGFSKSTLSNACENVGIQYEHFPELGIASWRRRDLQSEEDFRALFTSYKRHTLPRQDKAVNKIYLWMQSGECIALTCYERDPDQCHRHCVSEKLVQMLNQGVLFGNGDDSFAIGQNARFCKGSSAFEALHL